jgi:hypothetical protein
MMGPPILDRLVAPEPADVDPCDCGLLTVPVAGDPILSNTPRVSGEDRPAFI